MLLQGSCELFSLVAKQQTNQRWSGSLVVNGQLDFQRATFHRLQLAAQVCNIIYHIIHIYELAKLIHLCLADMTDYMCIS